MTGLDAVARLVGNIYDAALEPEGWSAVLRQILALTDGEAGHLIALAPDGARIALSANFDDVEARKYDEHYSRIDPVAPLLAMIPVGQALVCRNMISRHQADGAFYRDWAAPNRMGDAIFVNIGRERDSVSTLVLGRPWLTQPFGNAKTMQTLELLLPHLRRAAPGRHPLGTSRDLAPPDLIRTPHGCVLLASDGRVLHANAVARQITVTNEGLRLANDGLHARNPAEDALLQELLRLARLGRGGQARSGGRLTLQRARGLPVTVQTLPLGSHWLAQAFPGCTLVLVIDGERMARIGRQALQELYGLTPAEAALAVRIPGSRSLQKLANELGLSLSTVRTHLQRAFEKTGTHRQSELVQLIAELDRIGIDAAELP